MSALDQLTSQRFFNEVECCVFCGYQGDEHDETCLQVVAAAELAILRAEKVLLKAENVHLAGEQFANILSQWIKEEWEDK